MQIILQKVLNFVPDLMSRVYKGPIALCKATC